MATLSDPHGRSMRKLRVSLLDSCNFRCIYCMPEKFNFLKKQDWMSATELKNAVGVLVELGIEEIRLTGGEPTLRPDLPEIVSSFSQLPLKKLGMTTNGYSLKRILPKLKGSKLNYLNISLDTLNEKKFSKLTGTEFFQSVIDGILIAKNEGYTVKINTVLMRGKNDDEIFDFTEFSEKHKIEVRFLELMKIGVSRKLYESHFVPAHQIIETIIQKKSLEKIQSEPDSTAFLYKSDQGGLLGFIASESQPFCNHCSRLRLTAQGMLRSCLFKNDGISLKGKEHKDYEEILRNVISKKPISRIKEIAQPMFQIGG